MTKIYEDENEILEEENNKLKFVEILELLQETLNDLEIPNADFSETNKLLSDIISKIPKQEKVDIKPLIVAIKSIDIPEADLTGIEKTLQQILDKEIPKIDIPDTYNLSDDTIGELITGFEKAIVKIKTKTVYGGGGRTLDKTGLSTEDKQDNQITELQKLVGFEIPAHDYIALTYVASGNGVGEIETVVYKTGGSGGSIVATLTLAYNASNEISSVTKT